MPKAIRFFVLRLNRTTVNVTIATIAPILDFPQFIVLYKHCDKSQSTQEFGPLEGVWIDALAIVEAQHFPIKEDLLTSLQTLTVKILSKKRG